MRVMARISMSCVEMHVPIACVRTQTKKPLPSPPTPEAMGAVTVAYAGASANCRRRDLNANLFFGVLRAVAVGPAVRAVMRLRYENAAFAFLRGKATHRAVKTYDTESKDLQVHTALSSPCHGVARQPESCAAF